MKIRRKLLEGKSKAIIFGAGYIGYSTAAFYARQGVSSILIDIDPVKIQKINAGIPPYDEMKSWIGFDLAPLSHMITATADWEDVVFEGNPVYFIAVNTERDGKPWEFALEDVCKKIAKDPGEPLIIVESTLSPGWTKDYIIPYMPSIKIAVAPRRDWFTLPGMTVETLDRVVGATDEDTLEEAVDVLGIISKKIHRASSHEIAELVKAVENAYRFVEVAMSFELARAYSHLNVRELMELCGTKFNMDTYYPSTGIGGYCLPLASQYVKAGTMADMPILTAAEEENEHPPLLIADFLMSKGVNNVCILGVAYKGNLKVHVASPGLRLAEVLDKHGFVVTINDPLYTDKEIIKLTSERIVPVSFPEGMNGSEVIIITADHAHYKAIPKTDLITHIPEGCRIIDSYGVWADLRGLFKEAGILYSLIGEAGWLD